MNRRPLTKFDEANNTNHATVRCIRYYQLYPHLYVAGVLLTSVEMTSCVSRVIRFSDITKFAWSRGTFLSTTYCAAKGHFERQWDIVCMYVRMYVCIHACMCVYVWLAVRLVRKVCEHDGSFFDIRRITPNHFTVVFCHIGHWSVCQCQRLMKTKVVDPHNDGVFVQDLPFPDLRMLWYRQQVSFDLSSTAVKDPAGKPMLIYSSNAIYIFLADVPAVSRLTLPGSGRYNLVSCQWVVVRWLTWWQGPHLLV